MWNLGYIGIILAESLAAVLLIIALVHFVRALFGSAAFDAARRWASIGLVVIVPVFERRAAGVYHNSVAVIDADGTLAGVYRKMHIPDDPGYYEKYYFAPGDLGFKAVNTQVGRVGVLICWDQWYPEAARIAALRGADILFYPTAIGWN